MLPGKGLNLTDARKKIANFIRQKVEEANADGVVVGISGGIDSAVASYLSVEALGSRRVLGLIMPDGRVTPHVDIEDANIIADELGILTKFIDIATIHELFMKNLEPNRLAEGNLRARIRMGLLYYHANLTNRLVIGTGDRSEALVGYFCYDEKTRVVTPDGLKGYDELREGDKVYSYDSPTGAMVESRVDSVHVFDFDGNMIHFRGKGSDLMVTPNHRMLIRTTSDPTYSRVVFRTAEECLRLRSVVVPTPSFWAGRSNRPDSIELRFAQRHVPMVVRIPIDEALYMIGLFIGDGSATEGKAVVSVMSSLSRAEFQAMPRNGLGRFVQIPAAISRPTMRTYSTYETDFALPVPDKNEARTKLIGILERHGIGYSLTHDLVRIPSRGIYEFFFQFGIGAHNKHIPQWVKDYSSVHLNSLLRGLKDSDGSHSEAVNLYYTSSPRLKDDFVELVVKLGRFPTARERPPRLAYYKGKEIRSSVSYDISFGKRSHYSRSLYTSKAEKVKYKGKVWCPSVPPYENVLVERNGHYIFCGNTKFGDGGVDILPIGDLYKTEVRRMGEILGINRRIIAKRSSPRLWPGQTAEGELGMTYETIDSVFKLYLDQKLSAKTVSLRLKMDLDKVKMIVSKYRETAHKREIPEICRIRR